MSHCGEIGLVDYAPRLKNALTTAELALHANVDGHLPIEARRRIWDAMGPYAFDEDEYPTGMGHLRRATLACVAAGASHGVWANADGDDEPEEVLALVEGYLAGHERAETVWEAGQRLWDRVDFMQEGPLAWVIMSTFHAVNVAFGDELSAPGGSRSDELARCEYDAAYYAACAISGDHPSGGGSTSRRRTFWGWYIESAVPAAFDVALNRAAQ